MCALMWGPSLTVDACRRLGRFAHNCPYCRCPKDPPSSLLTSGLNKTDYLAVPASYEFLSSLPALPLACTFPTKQGHVVFSYVSPPKMKRYHSEGRFSTRQYKNKHFPFIGRINESEAHLVSIALPKQARNKPPSTIQPRASRFAHNGREEKQKKESSNSNASSGQNGNISSQGGSDFSRDLRTTPIQYLKHFPTRNVKQQLQNHQEILISEELLITRATNPLPQKYPTLNSIDTLQQRGRNGECLSSSQDCTSLNVLRQAAGQSRCLQSAKGRENELMASRMTEELQLNFDYYIPPDETDHSLSGRVEL